jgi:hypothetical protein
MDQFSINRIDAGEKYQTSALLHCGNGSWEVTPPMHQRGGRQSLSHYFHNKDI